MGFLALITTPCNTQRVIFDTLTFESLSPVINLAYIKKNYWNPTNLSITFLGPRCVQARATTSDAHPPTQPLPPPATHRQPPSTSVSMDPQRQMLQSIYQGHQIIVQGLHRLSVHLGMDPPLTTPEAFIQQVAWPGVQPSTDGGVSPLRSETLLKPKLGMTSL